MERGLNNSREDFVSVSVGVVEVAEFVSLVVCEFTKRWTT